MVAVISGAEAAATTLVVSEVASAGVKFGPQLEYTDAEWLAVLVEEVGEAAQLLNEMRLGKISGRIGAEALAEEVVQVGAVATRWLAAMAARP